MLRVGELIRHALSDLLTRGEVNAPALSGKVVTVSRVSMSPDLKCATAYILPLGGEGGDAVIEALDHQRKFMRTEIAQKVNLKFAPDLRFKLDNSFDNIDRIDALLNSERVRQDTGREQPLDLAKGDDGKGAA